MSGKAKFDQEAAFKSIIGAGREPEEELYMRHYHRNGPEKFLSKGKNANRVQRSYFLDRDIDKALRRMALEEEKNLTETVNDVLRKGLKKYL